MNQQLAKNLILYILKPKELKQTSITKYNKIKELLKNTELILLGEYIARIVTTITALANTQGGIIIYGISKDLNYYRKSIRIPKDIINSIKEGLSIYNYQPKVIYTQITQALYKKAITFIIIEVKKQDYLQMPIYVNSSSPYSTIIRYKGTNKQASQSYIHMIDAIKGINEDETAITKFYQNKFTNIKDVEYFKKEYLNLHKEIEITDDNLFHYLFKIKDNKYKMFYVMSFSLFPQVHFMNLNIHIYNNIDKITKEPYIIDGSIKMMFQKTILYLKNILNLKLKLKRNKLIYSEEYDLNIIKELLYNALIHRDYSAYTRNEPIILTLYKDYITIENPGIMVFDTKNPLESNTKIIRNPHIKRINDILLKEDIFNHGFKHIRTISLIYKYKSPKIEINDTTFKVTIYKDENPGIYKEPCTIDNILKYCIEPKSKLEIYNNLFKPNKIDYTYFYNKYIIPLIKNNALEYTIKDKPRSKNQKLITTEEMIKII